MGPTGTCTSPARHPRAALGPWGQAFSLLLLAGVAGADEPGDTGLVFERYASSVAKVQVVERESGAQAVIGSGFFAAPDGRLVTNYHVISKLIHHPDRYRAEFVDGRGSPHELAVRAVDVVHDLAVLSSEAAPAAHFHLRPMAPPQGARLFSLGFPHDLGITIVEGTFNGLLEHALYDKIHFTGSINPGMSGGPTITATGDVVGINVSTAGNQVSFLVPVDRAIALLARTPADAQAQPADFLVDVRGQLLAHQEHYLDDLLRHEGEEVKLGRYRLPGKLAPYFKCWGDTNYDEEDPYRIVTHECSTDDWVYVSGTHRSGTIHLFHRWLTSSELGAHRFFALYSELFEQSHIHIPGGPDEVTRYRCETDNVRNGDLMLRTVFCARRYRKLEGLYDAVLKTAVLGSSDSGIESTLLLSGVTFENARLFAQRFLEAIAWSE